METIPNSDIDIMIEIAPDAPVDLFEYVAITNIWLISSQSVSMWQTGASSNRSFGQAPRNLPSMRSNKTALALFDIRDKARTSLPGFLLTTSRPIECVSTP